MEELGNLGSIMFTDMNAGMNAFQRNFVSDLKRCDEVERHLRYIAEQIRLAGVPVGRREVRWRASLDELQHQLQDHEADLRQLHSSSQQLVASYNQLVELSHVLQKCDDIFSEAKASYTASHEEVLQPSSSADDLAAMALEGQQELEAFAPLPPVDPSMLCEMFKLLTDLSGDAEDLVDARLFACICRRFDVYASSTPLALAFNPDA